MTLCLLRSHHYDSHMHARARTHTHTHTHTHESRYERSNKLFVAAADAAGLLTAPSRHTEQNAAHKGWRPPGLHTVHRPVSAPGRHCYGRNLRLKIIIETPACPHIRVGRRLLSTERTPEEKRRTSRGTRPHVASERLLCSVSNSPQGLQPRPGERRQTGLSALHALCQTD